MKKNLFSNLKLNLNYAHAGYLPQINDNLCFLKHSHVKWRTLNTFLFPFFFPYSNLCRCHGHICGPPKILKAFIQKKIMLFFSLKIKKCDTYLCLVAIVDPAISIGYIFKVDVVLR